MKRPFLKVGIEKCSLLVMAGRAVAVGYEWKWPWNANSHCILENDDLLIYSPVSHSCPLFSSCPHYQHRPHCLIFFLLTILSSSPFPSSLFGVFQVLHFDIWLFHHLFFIFSSLYLLFWGLKKINDTPEIKITFSRESHYFCWPLQLKLSLK